MPEAHDIVAATPKCPASITEGPTSRRCATPMIWVERRHVWVCERHPHMEVAPDDFESSHLAPAQERDPIIHGRKVWR